MNQVSRNLSSKLWLYTNFDCNLGCSYCVTESTPQAPRRDLGLDNVRRLVDEGVELGFAHLFLTGGEPFILPDIYEMLAYASARVKTTVLSNAELLRGKRLERLCEIANDQLTVQVSLDGGRPEHHDPYRGEGTWARTVEGIRRLKAHNIPVCIGTTETPANAAHMDLLHEFRRGLGIADEDHFVRPLARRGFSREGLEVGKDNLLPEVTVTAFGVYWHPLISASATDMLVREQIFPLADGVRCIEQQLGTEETSGARTAFT